MTGQTSNQPEQAAVKGEPACTARGLHRGCGAAWGNRLRGGHQQRSSCLAEQRRQLTEQLALADMVICTAQVPGRQAPRLIDDAMLQHMRPGSVVVDMAVETGGNVECSKLGEEVFVNGDLERRVPHNLNVSFNFVEGESLMMAIKDVAVSSGSACTSASLEPSFVLRALGLSDELAHSSIRMTIGRFTTEADIDYAVQTIRENVARLRELSPLWEMYKDGVDLSTIQWAAH